MKRKYILGFLLASLCLISGCGNKTEENTNNDNKDNDTADVQDTDIKIIDLNSNSRPYAVVVNNYPKAVKVQTGLSDAYMVYEIPVEGGMSRSLALFKDKTTAKIGTVRSARHNFLDYALENDAIFVHWGWSHHAERDIPLLGINNINGLYDSPYWRENPEGLATEHTGYTGLDKLIKTAASKGYRQTSTSKPVLNYSSSEIDLTSVEGNKLANTVEIPYSDIYSVKFTYDSTNKNYKRYVNGVAHTDYFTKEHYTAKNIIVVKLDTPYSSDNYYLDLKNTGTGEGYYITDGLAVPITWNKKDRQSKTIYKYLDGTEIKVNDGNTYVMLQSNSKTLTIN